jgi:hypothetical protein
MPKTEPTVGSIDLGEDEPISVAAATNTTEAPILLSNSTSGGFNLVITANKSSNLTSEAPVSDIQSKIELLELQIKDEEAKTKLLS